MKVQNYNMTCLGTRGNSCCVILLVSQGCFRSLIDNLDSIYGIKRATLPIYCLLFKGNLQKLSTLLVLVFVQNTFIVAVYVT